MASRRMFALKLIDSAKFLKMPLTTQLLYFHLAMRADDDGIVEGYNILRMTGINEDDLKVLATKGFVKVLNDDLVAYITNWTDHNNIRTDRKIDSIYQDLLLKVVPDAQLIESKKTKKNRILTDKCQTSDRQVTDKCQTSDGQVTGTCHTFDRLGQDRTGQVRLGQVRLEQQQYTNRIESIKNDLKCSDSEAETIIKISIDNFPDIDPVVVVEEKMKIINNGTFTNKIGALVAAIKENWSCSTSTKNSKFCNFDARDIDYGDLENKLLKY